MRLKVMASGLAVGVAIAATVMPVPIPMTKVAAAPAQTRPWASANTSTMMAPEHGLMPTAKTAERPRRQPPGPARLAGSGPWSWSQASS